MVGNQLMYIIIWRSAFLIKFGGNLKKK